MWFLECDSAQVFNNKRIWLRPGTQFMLGRTRPDKGSPGLFLEHTSVSRKHLLVSVDDVKPGESSHVHIKSRLTVTDNSKIGTLVDGDKLSKDSRVLNRSEHVLKLGNHPALFRIKWVHMVFSFTAISKSAMKAEDPLAAPRAILEPLDIKCIGAYVTQYTSHIVTVKRNTSAVLQALVTSRHVVKEPYVEAIGGVGSKSSPEDQSLLEMDFDVNWPCEQAWLPAPGREPNPRPADSDQFLPNQARAEVFARYTFIFHDQSQHDSLMPAITGGGGKALVRQVQADEPDVPGMVEYIREVAGQKGDASFNLAQQTRNKTAGGIVVMRLGNGKVLVPGYYEKLDSILGQESVEQNELLDAILDVDASKLKREVPVQEVQQAKSQADQADRTEQPRDRVDPLQNSRSDVSMAERERQSPEQKDEQQQDAVSSPKDVKPSSSTMGAAARRRAARQRTAQPFYRGFDDFEPEASLARYQPTRSPSQNLAPDLGPSQVPSNGQIDVDSPGNNASHVSGTQRSATQQSQTQQSTRKRRGEPLDDARETTKDVVDGILKGAATMKRRKMEEQERKRAVASQAGVDEDDEVMIINDSPEAEAPTTTKKPRKRKETEMDVLALVNERRQAEEEARQRDEENLRAAFDGMDVAEIRNLAQVEEMDIIRKDAPPRIRLNIGDDEPSDRWDARWNGRKNFKKFRKQRPRVEGNVGGSFNGSATYERQRTRVIVPLKEVHKKAYGVGEDYWLESVEETKRKEREMRGETQSQRKTQSQRADASARGAASAGSASRPATQNFENLVSSDNEQDGGRFRRRIRNSRIQDAEVADAEEIFPEEIAGTARDGDIEAAVHESGGAGSMATTNSSARKGRRTAASTQATQTQTQILRSQGGMGAVRKRGAADEGDGSVAKKARAGAPSSGSVDVSASTSASASVSASARKSRHYEQEESDEEEDSLRFRRRER